MKSKILLYFCSALISFFYSSKLAASHISPFPFSPDDNCGKHVDNNQNNSRDVMSNSYGESLFGGLHGEKGSEYWQCAPEDAQAEVFGKNNGKSFRQGKITDFPLYSNKKIEAFINLYNHKKRGAFLKGVKRSHKYMKMIRRILREYKLPLELAYLPLVESNFNPNARSRASAVGLWQFIASTGKMFGLQKSLWHDDRYDPEKSTVAAAKYLKHLIQKFDGQWELALAAYNSGENKVQRAIKRARALKKPSDFWSLKLPRETRGYVPAFFAVAIMFNDPKAYGFKVPLSWPEEKSRQSIKVAGGVSLAKIARALDLSPQTIRRMNPALRRGDITPLGYRKYTLFIPARAKIVEKRGKIAALQNKRYKGWEFYKVPKGDTLSSISRRYRVRIDEITAFNPPLKRGEVLKAGQKIIVPFPVGSITSDLKSAPYNKRKEGADRIATGKKSKAFMQTSAVAHRVRKGDTLSNISRKYNISIRRLRRLNPILKRRFLQIGSYIILKRQREDRGMVYY